MNRRETDKSLLKYQCRYCDNYYHAANTRANHEKACSDKSKLVAKFDLKIKNLNNKISNQQEIIELLTSQGETLKEYLEYKNQ